MDGSVINLFYVVIAILLGVIAGLVAMQLARSGGSSWQASFCYGAGAFAGAVLLALEVRDHL